MLARFALLLLLMTAPNLQAEGSIGSGVTTGVPTITIPAHQANDILVVSAMIWAPNTTTPDAAQIPTPAGGWALIGSQIGQPAGSPRDGWIAHFWIRASGSGTTVTLTRGSGWDTGTDTCFNGRAYVIRGCRTSGDPWDATANSGPHTAANQAFPAVTVSGQERTVIIFGGCMDNTAFAMTSSGWTTGTEGSDTGGTDSAFQTALKSNVSASTSADTATVTAPGNAGSAYGFTGVSFKPQSLTPAVPVGLLKFTGIAPTGSKAVTPPIALTKLLGVAPVVKHEAPVPVVSVEFVGVVLDATLGGGSPGWLTGYGAGAGYRLPFRVPSAAAPGSLLEQFPLLVELTANHVGGSVGLRTASLLLASLGDSSADSWRVTLNDGTTELDFHVEGLSIDLEDYGSVRAINWTNGTSILTSAHDPDSVPFPVDCVLQLSGGTPPAPLAAATDYWVVSWDDLTGELELATSRGGTPIVITEASSGQLYCLRRACDARIFGLIPSSPSGIPTGSASEWFRLYFKSSGTPAQDEAGVWSGAGYALRLSMDQDPSGSAPQMRDSVSETNVGTSAGSMTSGDLVAGQVGQAIDFDGSDDTIGTSSPPSTATNNFGFDLLLWLPDAAGDGFAFLNGLASTNGWGVRVTSGVPRIYWEGVDGNPTGATASISSTQWHHIAGQRAAGTNEQYIDGALTSSGGGAPVAPSTSLTIGGRGAANVVLACRVDEMRIGPDRSADWIDFASRNLLSNASTIEWDALEVDEGGQTADVPVALIEFVGLAPTAAKSATPAIGLLDLLGIAPAATHAAPVAPAALELTPVAPTAAKSAPVPAVVVEFVAAALDEGGITADVPVGLIDFSAPALTTGPLTAAVPAIVIEFVSPSITSDSGNPAYLAEILVFHASLGEASGDRVDDVGSNDLTQHNTVGQTTGKVGDAALFDGISKYLSHTSNSVFQMGDTHWSIGFWVKLNSLPADTTAYSLVTKDVDSPANSRDFTIDYYRNDGTPTSGGFRLYVNGADGLVVSGTSGFNTTGVWYYVLVSHDPDLDQTSLQVNGGTIATSATSGIAPAVSGAEFRVGARAYSGFENYADAAIDQLAIFKGRPLTVYERAYLYNHVAGQTHAALSAPESQPLIDFDLLPVRSVTNTEVIPFDLGSSWFGGQIYDPCPVDDPTDSSRIKVYLSGMSSPTPSGTESIGLFHVDKSDVTDPANWTEVGVVLGPSGGVGDPDRYHVRLGSIFWNPDASEYWMYYTGEANSGASGPPNVSSICLATSSDGETFTRYGSNPILTVGGDGDRIEEPDVIPPWVSGLSVWVMIYCRVVGSSVIQLRTATSTDGLAWTKTGDGDILLPRADGSTTYPQWHRTRKIGDRYYLIFEDGSLPAPGDDPYVGYVATSFDPRGPFQPVKFPTPLLPASGVSGTWDFYHTATHTLFPINGVEYLFYCGTADASAYNGNWSLGVAQCIDPTNLITVASDTFTDANDTALNVHTMEVGSGWTHLAGTFKISSNKAIPNSDANNDIATTDVGVSNYLLTGTVNDRFSGGDFDVANFAIRISDGSHLWIALDAGAGTAKLYEDTGTGPTEVAIAPSAMMADNTLSDVRFLVNGASIACYIGGEVAFVYNLAHTNTEETLIGLRLGKTGTPAGVCSWDSLVVQKFQEVGGQTVDVSTVVIGFMSVAPSTAKSADTPIALVDLLGVSADTAQTANLAPALLDFTAGELVEFGAASVPTALVDLTPVAPATTKTAALTPGLVELLGVAATTQISAAVPAVSVEFAGVAPATTKAAPVPAASVEFVGVTPASTKAGSLPAARLKFTAIVATIPGVTVLVMARSAAGVIYEPGSRQGVVYEQGSRQGLIYESGSRAGKVCE